ncbi:MAG: cell division FtsZ family protein [Akkermansiaceae bacterium]|nr:cell division FtsZ family protein [Akkermansiaceae bacterium]
MISYTRDPQQTIPTSSVKIIGLGGGGTNILERVALDGMEGAELLALNTDIRTLSAAVAGEKIQLGRNLTKGLGTGGDPELGQQAMLEAESEIRDSLRGRRIVFLCVGLGGGTGSGAAPIVTRIAREEGAFVVVFATMPFFFEGKRRREQAETSLNELAVLSNALVTFDNNRMGELVLAKQGIHEAFAAADLMICESIKAVIRLVIRPGLINVGLDDLMSALRTNRSRCLFGSGLAEGKDRAAKALRNALASPLLDQGALLKDAQTVLVHLSGGEDLTLYEIELLMQRLQKFVPEKAHVLFGAAIDPAMRDSLSVTLISALPEDHLRAAPRDSLSSSLPENPVLDPSDSFASFSTPAITAKPEPETTFADTLPPVEESKPEPEPETELEPMFTSKQQPEAKPLPEPEPEPQPEPEPVAAVDVWDDEPPFAEAFADSPVEAAAPPSAPEPEEKPATHLPAASVPKPENVMRLAPDADSGAGKNLWTPKPPAPRADDEFPPDLEDVPAAEAKPAAEPPKLKLGVKTPTAQPELSFDTAPRGRFEGVSPNVVNGEDLDLPPFLRKKK